MKRRPSEARVCLFYSLSLLLCYRPIEDLYICSYEAHLNIKEEFILGFSPSKQGKLCVSCLCSLLYCTLLLLVIYMLSG